MSKPPTDSSHGGRRAGTGRKPKYENAVMIAASIPERLREKLDRFAEANELSRSEAVVEASRRLRLGPK